MKCQPYTIQYSGPLHRYRTGKCKNGYYWCNKAVHRILRCHISRMIHVWIWVTIISGWGLAVTGTAAVPEASVPL